MQNPYSSDDTGVTMPPDCYKPARASTRRCLLLCMEGAFESRPVRIDGHRMSGTRRDVVNRVRVVYLRVPRHSRGLAQIPRTS